jgi:hypothetical protein
MKSHVNLRMFLESFNEGKIRIGESFFEHMAEIAARLMGVDDQDEMEVFWHGDGRSNCTNIITCRREFRVSRANARSKHARRTAGRAPLQRAASAIDMDTSV